MKKFTFAASVVALSLVSLVPAMADEDTNACRDLNRKTTTALAAASGDTAEARREAHIGSENCSLGLPKVGAAHYRKALALLGN